MILLNQVHLQVKECQARERESKKASAMYQPTKDMKHLTFFSIYRESFNIISSNTNLFTQIAIFFASPLYIISIFVSAQSSILLPQQSINQLNTTTSSSDSYINQPIDISSWTFAVFLIYLIAFVISTGLSLLTFSSIVYAVACICTEHNATTMKTMICAFKKAWKKLLLTRLLQLAIIVGYTLVILELVWFISLTSPSFDTLLILALVLILLAYIGGVLYISVYWAFSGVVAVLESTYGWKALSKSKSLIKGKTFLIIKVVLPISLFNLTLGWLFSKVVVNEELIGLGLVIRIGFGVAGLIVMVFLTEFAVVVRTVTYLVCKADKGESITKSNVMDHLDIYVDGYDSLEMAKDEQI